jgi:membrane fusion protein, heavy metal efflux system
VALRLLLLIIVGALATGCNRSSPSAAAPEEPEGLSVTKWTEKTELFAEYPPLVAGSTSRFAIHLTRLDTFKALTDGNVEVRLQGGPGPPEVFRVNAPSRPGIFGVDVKPTHAGKRELVIALNAPGLNLRSGCQANTRREARAGHRTQRTRIERRAPGR